MDKQAILDTLEAAHAALFEDREADARAAVSAAHAALTKHQHRAVVTQALAQRLETRLEIVESILKDGKPHTMRELRGRCGLNNTNVKPVLDEAVRRGLCRKIDHDVRPGLAFLYVQC